MVVDKPPLWFDKLTTSGYVSLTTEIEQNPVASTLDKLAFLFYYRTGVRYESRTAPEAV
jgi:hypothetical protein